MVDSVDNQPRGLSGGLIELSQGRVIGQFVAREHVLVLPAVGVAEQI
jgi:hypothetical protein